MRQMISFSRRRKCESVFAPALIGSNQTAKNLWRRAFGLV